MGRSPGGCRDGDSRGLRGAVCLAAPAGEEDPEPALEWHLDFFYDFDSTQGAEWPILGHLLTTYLGVLAVAPGDE